MLTPTDVANKKFNKTMGYGYRMDDVDSFLAQTASAMTELVNQNADTQKKLEILADKLTEYREDEESLRTALLGAQKLGDSVIRESKTKAEIFMRDATIKAEMMVENAKRQIEGEQAALDKLKKEVASFKGRLLSLYKQHIELVSALPGEEEAKVQPDSEPQPKQAAPAPSTEDEPMTAEDIRSQELEDEELFDDTMDGIAPARNSSAKANAPIPFKTDDSAQSAAQSESKFGRLRFGEGYDLIRDDEGFGKKR